MATETFYADAGGDGQIRGGSNTSWSAGRTSGTYTAAAATDKMMPGYFSTGGDEYTYVFARGFLPFDTSSLPDNAIISSATLNLYVTNLYYMGTGSSDFACCVVASTQASNTALTTSDWGSWGTTEFAARTKYSSWGLNGSNPNAYKTITLNASGIANISVTGWSKFAFISDRDFDNNQPGAGVYGGGYIYQSDRTGTSTDPYLSVTYTQPPTKPLVARQAVNRAATY